MSHSHSEDDVDEDEEEVVAVVDDEGSLRNCSCLKQNMYNNA